MGILSGAWESVGKMNHKPDQFQQHAIDSTANGIRIVAPAGSGKSETLARRIAKRIDRDGVDPRRILVLTFDNAAKKSLNGFFDDFLGRAKRPNIQTFNAHGWKIIRDYFPDQRMKLPNEAGSQDAKELQRQFNQLGLDFPVLTWDGVQRTVEEAIRAQLEQGFLPGWPGDRERLTKWLRNDYLRLPNEGESASLDEFWGMPSTSVATDGYAAQLSALIDLSQDYDKKMRALGRMDWIDQKARAVEQLRGSRNACEQLQSEFDEIIVDECQDISRLDAMLVYFTAGASTRVVLAGDDDQTLYEWRNAHSLYLRKPELVFRDIEFETIHLNLNYRSPRAILEPAVRLIAGNVERIAKSPTSGVLRDGEVQTLAFGSSNHLHDHLTTSIRDEIAAGRSPLEIAVLCHAREDRAMRAPLEQKLREAGIPVVETSGNEQDITKPGVWVRGFLKSKGRQWPVVYIPAANDRDLPDNESVRKGEVESIRRRFYVAMTRASEKLVFSYVRGGDTDRIDVTAEGEVVGTNGASRFLFEAGLVTEPAVSADEQLAETTDTTANVKAITAQPEAVEQITAPTTEIDPVIAPTPEPEHATVAPLTPELPATRRKGKLQPWDATAEDTRQLQKATREWESLDYDTAILCAWKPVERLLKRITKSSRAASPTGEIIKLIDTAFDQGLIDGGWRDRLHLWRKVRNQASHGDEIPNSQRPIFMDHGYQLIQGAPELFAYVAERNAPKQLVMETQDDFAQRLGALVSHIQMGKPSPITGKPLKALRFDSSRDQFDVLAMQLLMVLRDVRFYVPEEYRWSASPLVNKFCVDAIGFVPNGFQTKQASRLKLQQGEQMSQLLARFDRIIHQECGDVQPGVFLRERIEDGIRLENGNFHAGIKLNPRS